MRIRLACLEDIGKIADTYQQLLSYKELHGSGSNWKQGVCPTIQVPEEKVPRKEMFVLEEEERSAEVWC